MGVGFVGVKKHSLIMVVCSKCGYANSPGSKYCSECGCQLERGMGISRVYVFVVLGAGGVGKSAVTVKFVTGQFMEKYNPTIEDSFSKTLEVDGIPCRLSILDTAGTETFTALRQLYFEKGNGFILVYSIIAPGTFGEVKNIREQIVQKLENTDIPMVLVGNKADLNENRKVKFEDGENLAKELSDRCRFMETSAKSGTNIKNIFETLVTLVWDKEGKPKLETKKKKKGCVIL